MQTYSKPILGLSTIQSTTFVELFRDYRKELAQAGYNPCVARLHLRSVALQVPGHITRLRPTCRLMHSRLPEPSARVADR
jgi:hypothetical protein